MGKVSKRGREQDTYEADDFVENDDGSIPKTKKTKKTQVGSSKDENKTWQLSSGHNPRRVEVTEFKGTKLINIREYYEKDGDYMPGKKGISLTVDQYKALLEAIPEVNAHLGTLGVEVNASAVINGDSEEEAEPQKRIKPKKTKKEEKANIEATSDEEDE